MEEVKERIETAKKRKARITKLSAYLENGLYVFDKDLRSVFNVEKSDHLMVHSLKGAEQQAGPSISIESSEQKSFDGKAVWFCINGDIKIFSDDEVLTICTSSESYQRKIDNYAHFSSFFCMLELVSKHAESNMLTEEFVRFSEKTENDEVFIFNKIYDDYRNYFNHLTSTSKVDRISLNDLLATSSNAKYIHQFEIILEKIAPELLSLELPYINLNGDLWSDNVLLSHEEEGKVLWYIDWETAGSYIFFYDFFKFMWNELGVHKNHSYCENYLLGRCDEKISRLFALFDVEFQPRFRQSYFCLFFLNYILNDTDNIPFKYKYEEVLAFERNKILKPYFNV